jgi:serine-type D-Ala-D-Ala carboxypeptidase (penicillin-binding protein 5/6)
MLTGVSSVLTPVRRRRRRYRLRRLTPLVAGVVLALAVGAWMGAHRHTAPTVPAADAARPLVIVQHGSPAAKVVKRAAAPLVVGGSAIRHSFSPRLLAASAIVIDAKSGRVLWARRPHQRRQIASTTKIMTALLALPKLKPMQLVTVSPAVTRVPLVREGLRAGEKVRAWKLFYAMLLYSGNDDALQVAIAAGGNKASFVRRMNAEAHSLGLRDTHYVSPSGVIDKGNYSSAWDLAAVTRVAMRNPRFRHIVRTRIIHVKWSAPTYSKIYVNNNLMLGLYRGATGVKTGYTHRSGPCLVASATRGGASLIAVVLDSPDMYTDARRLLNFGFAALS